MNTDTKAFMLCGRAKKEVRVGRGRTEPGRHQPEHAILSCFRVMKLIQGAQYTERDAGTGLSDPFLSDQHALFPFNVMTQCNAS